MNVVKVEQVSLGYRRRPLARDVNFTLRAGQITCLLGANGCGKTTLMRTLLGLMPPLAGDISLYDRPISRWPAAELARAVAYVPQAHDGPFAFRVREMVMMGCSARLRLFTSPGKREHALARQALAALGIAHLERRLYPTLSGGERQLVLIARALVQQPSLLVMDEPASSLDFGHQIALLEQVRRLQAGGMTILMSTHHPMHAQAVADSVILMSPEHAVRQGAPAEMLSAEALAAIYQVSPAQIRRHFQGNPVNDIQDKHHAD